MSERQKIVPMPLPCQASPFRRYNEARNETFFLFFFLPLPHFCDSGTTDT